MVQERGDRGIEFDSRDHSQIDGSRETAIPILRSLASDFTKPKHRFTVLSDVLFLLMKPVNPA